MTDRDPTCLVRFADLEPLLQLEERIAALEAKVFGAYVPTRSTWDFTDGVAVSGDPQRFETALRRIVDDARDEGRQDCRDSVDEQFIEEARKLLKLGDGEPPEPSSETEKGASVSSPSNQQRTTEATPECPRSPYGHAPQQSGEGCPECDRLDGHEPPGWVPPKNVHIEIRQGPGEPSGTSQTIQNVSSEVSSCPGCRWPGLDGPEHNDDCAHHRPAEAKVRPQLGLADAYGILATFAEEAGRSRLICSTPSSLMAALCAASERAEKRLDELAGVVGMCSDKALPEVDAASRDHQLVNDLLERWRVDSAFCFMVRGQLARLLAQVREEGKRSCCPLRDAEDMDWTLEEEDERHL